jgi:chromosome partitioning protein
MRGRASGAAPRSCRRFTHLALRVSAYQNTRVCVITVVHARTRGDTPVAIRNITMSLADLRPLVPVIDRARAALRRKVVVLVNGKGGVGKTSLAVNFGASCARLGQRVLLVEMDPQGNHGEDLGYHRDGSLNDNGKSQADAILNSTAIEPTGEARPHLWVAPGGDHLERVQQELYVQARAAEMTGDSTWVHMYAVSLAYAAQHYDKVILDVAPGSAVLQLQALVAGDMMVIPSRSDPSSRKGLRAVAKRVNDARTFNPDLAVLGIVLFATGSRAFRVQADIRRKLEGDLHGAAPVFSTNIRHVEAAAVACRTAGRVAQEHGRDDGLDDSLRRSVVSLGSDYGAVTTEIMEAIAVLISQEQT